MKILLIEDEPTLRTTLTEVLHFSHQVEATGTGQEGLFHAQATSYDLIILDVNLPDMNGFQVCSELREHKIKTPILFLTAHADTTSKVRGLDAGGDDYLVKPFSVAELEARIRALSRRPITMPLSSRFVQGNLVVDTLSRQVFVKRNELKLTKKEYLFLEFFIRHLNQLVTREQLLQYAWDFHHEPNLTTIDAHLNRLRRKLQATESVTIKTLRNQGYRLEIVKKTRS